MIPSLLSDWLVKIAWKPSSVSVHPHWMAKVTWNFSSASTHFQLANWNHMTGFISQHTFLLDNKRSHEWSWMPCVGTLIPIGCWKSNGSFLWEHVFKSFSYQHQMTHDIMLMSYSYIMLYHIFIFEWFCLHLLGLWLGGFNGFRISLWYEFL